MFFPTLETQPYAETEAREDPKSTIFHVPLNLSQTCRPREQKEAGYKVPPS
jgi:hypothetical protein